MSRFVKATYYPEHKTVEFLSQEGRHFLRTGGSLNWRTNNVGNLSSPLDNVGVPNPKRTKGFIGFARGGKLKDTEHYHQFFIFPDADTGRRELDANLKRMHGDKTLPQLMKKFAPDDDRNDTDKYVQDVVKITGVSTDKKLSEYTDAEFKALGDAIVRLEGYDSDAESRQERWVDVAHITATDGSKPVAGEPLMVKQGDKTTTIKSGPTGKFPPIVHSSKGPIELQHLTADGVLKKVGSLVPGQSDFMTLHTRVLRFFGWSGPDKPAPGSPGGALQPVRHVVKPQSTELSVKSLASR